MFPRCVPKLAASGEREHRVAAPSAIALPGPAILDQFDCTTVVCPGQTARVDEWKNIIITEDGRALS